MLVTFPSLYSINELRAHNPLQQIALPSSQQEGTLTAFQEKRCTGHLFRPTQDGDEVLITSRPRLLPDGYLRILQASCDVTNHHVDLSNGQWVRHPSRIDAESAIDYALEIQRVVASWNGVFSYILEDASSGVVGLRKPQIGAVHAVHAHWAVSDEPATIVMPTGTGKTETMLSLLVSACCPKLLVIVPTDALRTQLANKFLSLGVLKHPGCTVLHPDAKYPLVCTLLHIPRSPLEVDDIFLRSQVFVTTSSIAAHSDPAVQERMAHHCPYLFIDEAHHVEAPTWSAFKKRFQGKKILQFTATPYREDGKAIEGTIAFKYPLRKAQQEGYFKPICFKPVIEFNLKRSDVAIAQKAIEQLREDFDKGHILMARVDSVARAKDVFRLYSQYPEFHPVELHTGIKSQKQRDLIRRRVIAGEARIVVCVDMLGEGFDLPELKIAAFHDIRKTLAVTLQLAGRFTRARSDLGDATFIANTADINVQEELRKLYARDPDWNVLLPELSERMIGEQLSLQEFLQGFSNFEDGLPPLRSVHPALSTVVYKTTCSDWTPENSRAGIPAVNSCEQIHETINHAQHTLVIMTARRVPLDWADIDTLFGWSWELYIAIWSPEQNLLFINSSTNSGEYAGLAHALAGEDATLIQGQDVFRVFDGMNRLRLQSVGLSEQLGRNVRFTNRMGADIAPALPGVQRGRARKAVLAGSGYEGGARATVGASCKGRIWSHRRGHLDRLADWCKTIGDKLLDDAIDPDEVLRGTLNVTTVWQRPPTMPLYVDWPEAIITDTDALWSIVLDGREHYLYELDLDLVSPSTSGELRFAIVAESDRVELELEISGTEESPTYRFVVLGDRNIFFQRGHRANTREATEFFYYNPPKFWFADGSSLEGSQHTELRNPLPPFDANKIEAWHWGHIDIRRESQGIEKDPATIQATLIKELLTRDFDMLVDDDSSGESADVVAIRVLGGVVSPSGVEVEFYHCKYSEEATPGHRVKDLYEVCGQAQKSISWLCTPERTVSLFTHLLRREALRREKGASSRYERGDNELLLTIREISRQCRIALKIFVVQPGVSKGRVSEDQLQLLSVTENHLMETYQISFGVIASP